MTMTIAERSKSSWDRAKRLAAFLRTDDYNATRAYLATQSLDQKQLLDTDTDARNPAIRTLMNGFYTWNSQTKAPRRRSKGDPTRQVRAGAPTPDLIESLINLRKYQQTNGLTTEQLLDHAKALHTLTTA